MAITPNSQLSNIFAGLAVGTQPNVLENIILAGARDLPILRDIKRVNINNVKSVWVQDTIKPPQSAQNSAKPYVKAFTPNTTSTKFETENVVQILRDDVSTAKIFQKINSVDPQGEHQRLLAKTSLEHANDMENIFWGSQSPYLAPDNTTGNICGGLFHFASSKIHTISTELTFDDILEAQQDVYEAGGDPRRIYCNAGTKKHINTLLRDAKTIGIKQDSTKLDFAISTIETDFGVTDIIINRFMNDRPMTIVCLDPEYIELGILQNTTITKEETANGADSSMIMSAITYHFRNINTIAITTQG